MYNKIFNSHPLVIHSPSDNLVWDKIKNWFFKTPKQFLELKNITIITWNNKKEKSVLEKSLDHLNLPYIVLGQGITDWVNTKKIQLTNEILEKIDTPYVLGIDAFDAIILDNPNKAIDKLKPYKMLFNATSGTLRSLPKHIEFFENIYSKQIYKHLNAGAWFGETDFCRDFFIEAQIVHEGFSKVLESYQGNEQLEISEQVRIKQTFLKFYPQVGIDHHCQIFQLLNHPSLCPVELGKDQGCII